MSSSYSRRKYYTYNYRQRRENPVDIIVWCRNNFGDRGAGWDFSVTNSSGEIRIEIWNDRLDVMWLMFKE